MLIAVSGVGAGVQLEELLTKAGARAKWDGSQADGPSSGTDAIVVLVDADHLGERLVEVTELWREQPSVPGVVAIGSSDIAREQAPRARVALLQPTAKIQTIASAIKEAAQHRLAAGMKWGVLRAAAGMPPIAESAEMVLPTIVAARKVDIEIARTALRWHAAHYATGLEKLDRMREERMLAPAELAVCKQLDGTRTVQTIVRSGPTDPQTTARFLWTLGCLKAVDFTAEVRDLATPARRMLHDVRTNLVARVQRLDNSTFYDVLEIPVTAEYPEIEDAYQRVAQRYHPTVLENYDLVEHAQLIGPMWELVEKARSVLVDHAQRGRYHDWLRQNLPQMKTVWALDPGAATAAAEAFARGQASLGEGDAHKAMRDMAFACRQFPGHPEYEANLAWVRYRVQVASGKDRVQAAIAERKAIEDLLLGCRVWPKALVALALLSTAAGEPDSARWHLHLALLADPSLPAAHQLAQRLGMRR